MNIPRFAMKVKNRLEEKGFEAYFVGGCVRDCIMGTAPHDYDITTNALPGEIKECFFDFGTILTGEKHGTVTVVSEGENVEVTTYRVDGGYSDLRHPEKVSFAKNVCDDLSRRDFTINAICFSEGFVDPFGGMEDIKNKIIRTVGEPDKRFAEDALRIMRALRFSATLGFEIEKNTKLGIHKNARLLKNISQERLYAEFSRLLTGKNAENVLLEYSDVISVFIPETKPCIGFDQKNEYHIYDVYTHMVKATGFAPYNLTVRLAAFFHDIGKPESFTIDEKGGHFKGHSEKSRDITEKVLKRLKVDNNTKNLVTELVAQHQRSIIPQRKYVKRVLMKFSPEFFDMLMCLMEADTLAHSKKAEGNLSVIEQLREIKASVLAEGDCVSLKTLEINGNDLIKAGVTEGKKIGEILKTLLEKVIDGGLENDREKLMEEVKKHLAENKNRVGK